jgi:hypothetical protein
VRKTIGFGQRSLSCLATRQRNLIAADVKD